MQVPAAELGNGKLSGLHRYRKVDSLCWESPHLAKRMVGLNPVTTSWTLLDI
jgi:hypothetical protein